MSNGGLVLDPREEKACALRRRLEELGSTRPARSRRVSAFYVRAVQAPLCCTAQRRAAAPAAVAAAVRPNVETANSK